MVQAKVGHGSCAIRVTLVMLTTSTGYGLVHTCVLCRLRPAFSGHRTDVMFPPNSVYYMYATEKANTRVPAFLGASGVAMCGCSEFLLSTGII